jgi:uncharacterized protein involved in exopolysaccharide biosynthesis
MNDAPADKASQLERVTHDRLVYVVPEQAFGQPPGQEVNLREISRILWRRKWLIILVTAAFAAASVAYALLASEWYRAEVLLAPAEEQSDSSLGGLGGLAALAGVNVAGSEGAEAIAVLRSRELARSFIEEFGLLTVFFADKWDPQGNRWKGNDPRRWPDIRDAVKYFHDRVLTVSEDRQTRLVTVGIEWRDADVAAVWATELVQRANARQRQRALREAETNVAYLQEEMASTGIVTLQQSIGRLLETELQKLMLARGNEEYAFRVIDGAAAPREPVRPKRVLVAVIGTLLGAMIAVFGVLLVHAMRTEEGKP